MVLPDAVSSIGTYFFDGCSSMTTVTIGSSCTTMSSAALRNCTSLAKLFCKATTPPTVVSSTFTGVPTTCIIYVPTSSTSTY